MNEWLRQRPTWVIALIWGGAMALAWLVGSGLAQWSFRHHHLDPAYLIGGAVFAGLTAAGLAAWQHHASTDWWRKRPE